MSNFQQSSAYDTSDGEESAAPVNHTTQHHVTAGSEFVNPFRPEGDSSLSPPVPAPPAPGVQAQEAAAAAAPAQETPSFTPFAPFQADSADAAATVAAAAAAVPPQTVPSQGKGGLSSFPAGKSSAQVAQSPKARTGLSTLSTMKTGSVEAKMPTATIRDTIGVAKGTHLQALPRTADVAGAAASGAGGASQSPFQMSPLRREMAGRSAAPRAVAAQETPPTPAEVFQKKNSEPAQLTLRAIFGVTRDLNEAEILKYGSALPGITKLAIAPKEAVSDSEDFCHSIENLGVGDADDIVSLDGVSIVVKHEGEYAPGVRETLMLLAREIAKL